MLTHDGVEVARFQDDTTSNKDNVVAAGQKRDAVCDKDPSFCRKQSARPYNMIYKEFITQITFESVR